MGSSLVADETAAVTTSSTMLDGSIIAGNIT
jgi:hypothetical protein